MSAPYDPKAVRVVLIAFKMCEEKLKALRNTQELPDSLRVRVADEILTLVDGGETELEAILQTVVPKFSAP